MGWASQENGTLLALASGKFDVFVTTDQSLSYQQSVSNFAIAVVVLVARRNKLEFLLPLIPGLLRAMEQKRPAGPGVRGEQAAVGETRQLEPAAAGR